MPTPSGRTVHIGEHKGDGGLRFVRRETPLKIRTTGPEQNQGESPERLSPVIKYPAAGMDMGLILKQAQNILGAYPIALMAGACGVGVLLGMIIPRMRR